VVSEHKYPQYDWVLQKLIDENYIVADVQANSLSQLVEKKDVFIGVSAKNLLKDNDVKNMNEDAIVFALANPEPEINPLIAKSAGARIVGTGRSDFPNQINNVLVFPGLMKGALKARARSITDEMKIIACRTLADLVSDAELNEEFILPDIFDLRVVDAVAEAVYQAGTKIILTNYTFKTITH